MTTTQPPGGLPEVDPHAGNAGHSGHSMPGVATPASAPAIDRRRAVLRSTSPRGVAGTVGELAGVVAVEAELTG